MTQATHSAATQSLRYFAVTVRFGNHDDEGGPYDIPGGVWRGLAKDQDSAEAKAYDACWDSRLDITGCYPVYESEEVERYCASARWQHVFVGNREETVRWVFDRGTQTMVAAQVLDGERWVNLDASPLSALQQRIVDIADDEGIHELQEWEHSPDWQEVEAQSEA